MFKSNDPYTYTLDCPLRDKSDYPPGMFTAQYQVTHYDDVQMSSGEAQTANARVRKYILSCTQRIKIYNKSGMTLSPQTDVSFYLNYPALLNTLVKVEAHPGISLQLLGYSPQTVNTQVQTSGTIGSTKGETQSSATSNTVGSSTAQTNSYDLSIGFQGTSATGGASVGHSTTTTGERSKATTSEAGHSSTQESSSSASMSIKDWGVYGQVNPATGCPSWTFGQEYPWDAIRCRMTNNTPYEKNKAQVDLVLPQSMKVRLQEGTRALYPPSHLSMFGINFVMAAQWLITVAEEASSAPVEISHIINYFTASHALKDNDVAVYMDSAPTVLAIKGANNINTKLDLGVMGLDPVGNDSAPPVVGFVPSKFTRRPSPAGKGTAPVPFSIFSTTNTLLVRDTTVYPSSCAEGAGFSPSETALTATLDGTCTTLKFTLLFKVIDTTTNYTLHLKHWKGPDAGVKLNIVINGDTANALVKYVDAMAAVGGEHNLLSIALRNLDFTSVDYSDMLTLGLNSIDITLTPVDGKSAKYVLRAVSIEP